MDLQREGAPDSAEDFSAGFPAPPSHRPLHRAPPAGALAKPFAGPAGV